MPKLDNILVYHWQAWRGFLVSHLVADYCMVEASYEHDFSHLKKHLTPNIQAVLFQINLSDATHYPAQKQQLITELESRNILVLNKEVEDIRKANLHRLLEQAGLPSTKASQSGPGDEQLFVKSNLNWGGQVEKRLPQALHSKFIGEHKQHIERWDGYYKIKRNAVSEALWQDPGVVIERYIDNAENSFYRVYCFGDSVVVVKAYSDALIKKISADQRDRNFRLTRAELINDNARENITLDLPRRLLVTLGQFLQHYPLAWFCLDVLHNHHEYFIADLNLTPWSGEQPQTEKAVSFLTKGGKDFIQANLAKLNKKDNRQQFLHETCSL